MLCYVLQVSEHVERAEPQPGPDLPQSRMEPGKADYHGAIERWALRHKPRTALCFVQFHKVHFDQMPRAYLATPIEVAERLRATAKGRGDTILYERKEWTERAHAAGTVEEIPASWRFTPERVEQLLVGD